MIPREILETIVKDQRSELTGITGNVPREITKTITFLGSSAIVVKGIRRCGKSTVLRELLREKHGDAFYYANFDDERLMGFGASDFQTLMEVFIANHGELKTILLDEVQNVAGWELFVNRLLRQNFTVFITGSNADLLSKELGTHLTGRHLDYALYPFSFREYLKIDHKTLATESTFSTPEKARLLEEFKQYLVNGGMPEAAIHKNPAALNQVLEDIIQKDIIRRYAIRKPMELRNVIKFLIWNASNRMTYTSICNNFGIKSPVTVQKYVHYAEETYLVMTVNKYDRKIRRFDKNSKKIYCIDNGIIVRHSPATNQMQGALLENLVAVELKRRNEPAYYYVNKTGTETDFVVVDEKTRGVTQAIQVCLDPALTPTQEREEKALLQTLKETSLEQGVILTLDYEQTKKTKNKTLHYKPAWKWLLEGPAQPKTKHHNPPVR